MNAGRSTRTRSLKGRAVRRQTRWRLLRWLPTNPASCRTLKLGYCGTRHVDRTRQLGPADLSPSRSRSSIDQRLGSETARNTSRGTGAGQVQAEEEICKKTL